MGDVLASPAVARFLAAARVDIVCAWGISAALAAWMALRALSGRRPALVLELFDPALGMADRKLLRVASGIGGLSIVCGSQIVRRRLIEAGVGPEFCAVIRPGVDFATINTIRRGSLRASLGIAPTETAVLLPEPVRRDEGTFSGFWAAVLLHELGEGFRIIVPGRSREVDRIRRLAAALPAAPRLLTPGPDVPFEHLVAIADVLLVSDRNEVPTTAIAWAMASGAAVIAAAGYSITELVAHKVNGLLFSPRAARSMIPRIVKLLRDRESQVRLKEAARGQAYEVFSTRRYVDQHISVFQNVLRGTAPGRGITDSAAVA